MSIDIHFTEEQLDALIDVLSFSAVNRFEERRVKSILNDLPPEIAGRVATIIAPYNKIYYSDVFLNINNIDLFIKRINYLYSAKPQAFFIDREVFLNKAISKFFDANKEIAHQIQELILNNTALSLPVKRILIMGLSAIDLASKDLLMLCLKQAQSKKAKSEDLRLVERILSLQKAKYESDIELLMELGNHPIDNVAVTAVKIADEKLLPCLVGVENKSAQVYIKMRMNSKLKDDMELLQFV